MKFNLQRGRKRVQELTLRSTFCRRCATSVRSAQFDRMLQYIVILYTRTRDNIKQCCDFAVKGLVAHSVDRDRG
jgi:hypothetical protein